MLCLSLTILIVLFLVFVSGQDVMESLHERYQLEESKMRKEICAKKPDYGKCKGRRSLWYFNENYGKCMRFTYSNCGGNRNRFYTKDACEDYCDKFDWSSSQIKFKQLNKWNRSPKKNLKAHA